MLLKHKSLKFKLSSGKTFNLGNLYKNWYNHDLYINKKKVYKKVFVDTNSKGLTIYKKNIMMVYSKDNRFLSCNIQDFDINKKHIEKDPIIVFISSILNDIQSYSIQVLNINVLYDLIKIITNKPFCFLKKIIKEFKSQYRLNIKNICKYSDIISYKKFLEYHHINKNNVNYASIRKPIDDNKELSSINNKISFFDKTTRFLDSSYDKNYNIFIDSFLARIKICFILQNIFKEYMSLNYLNNDNSKIFDPNMFYFLRIDSIPQGENYFIYKGHIIKPNNIKWEIA